jgi:uncharacterized repeat protein (TIGR02543 family)
MSQQKGRTMKRTIALLLVVVLAAGGIPGSRIFAEEKKSETEQTGAVSVTETDNIKELAAEVSPMIEDTVSDTNKKDSPQSQTVIVQSEKVVTSSLADSIVQYGNLYVLSYDGTEKAKEDYEQFKKRTDIDFVELDAVMETAADKVVATEKPGERTVFKDYLNSLEQKQEIKVAVVDSGVNVDDAQLKDRTIESSLNFSGSGKSVADDNGHGTKVASAIASVSPNSVKILPVKVANKDGKSTVLAAYLGIKSAIEAGAQVINLSMNAASSVDRSNLLQAAIDEAYSKGIYVVVSAGNDRTDTKEIVPSNIKSALVVSAVGDDQKIADYSNFGESVDYAAYGTYGKESGTSYAAAYVSGTVATLLSGGICNVTDTLNKYAVDLGEPGKDVHYGNGLLECANTGKEEMSSENVTEKKPDTESDSDNTEEYNTYLRVSALANQTGWFYITANFAGDNNGWVTTRFDIDAGTTNSSAPYTSTIKIHPGAANPYKLSVTAKKSIQDGFQYYGYSERYYIIPITIKCAYKSGVGMHVTDDDAKRSDYPDENKYSLSQTSDSGGFTFQILTSIFADSAGNRQTVSGIDTNCIGLTNYAADYQFHHTTFGFSFDYNTGNVYYNANGGMISDTPHLNGSYYYKLKSGVLYRSNAPNGTYKKVATELTYGTNIDPFNTGTFGISKTGYHLNAGSQWNSKSDGTGTDFDQTVDYAPTSYIADIKTTNDVSTTLYAKWIANTYTVVYNGNGATSGSMLNSIHTYDTAKNLAANKFSRAYTATFNANGGICTSAPLTDTYTFKKWNTGEYGSGTDYADTQSVLNLSTTNGASLNLYAQWTPETIALPTATKKGYELLGWNTSSTATTPLAGYIAGAKVTLSADTTLYAVWKLKTMPIHYNANGGTGAMADGVKTWGVSYTIAQNAFSRAGYTFLGWNTTPGATEIVYQSGNTYVNQTISDYDSGQGINFYAVWQANIAPDFIGMDNNKTDIADTGESSNGYAIGSNVSYTMNNNTDESTGKKHFEKSEPETFNDELSGEKVTEQIESTVVGWEFGSSESDRINFSLGESIATEKLLELAKKANAITVGAPNSDFKSSVSKSVTTLLKGNMEIKQTMGMFATSSGTSSLQYVNLYAKYDEGVKIHAQDLYYTLKSAQSGIITEKELLSRARAYDEELISENNLKGEVSKGTDVKAGTTFDVLDYSPTDFTAFTSEGSVSETFRVVDSVGNVTKRQIMVHIVDTTPTDTDPDTGKTRFISKKYFPSTVEEDSPWLTNPEYKTEMEEVLSNERVDQELSPSIFGVPDSLRVVVPGSGQWKTEPEQIWQFSNEDVQQVKNYVNVNGIGNLLKKDALTNFVNEFKSNRVK